MLLFCSDKLSISIIECQIPPSCWDKITGLFAAIPDALRTLSAVHAAVGCNPNYEATTEASIFVKLVFYSFFFVLISMHRNISCVGDGVPVSDCLYEQR